jgi:hypothetical protein
MTYRPITDTWFLTRAKLKNGQKFYGSYPGGFPERARALLGVSILDPVLHVCGGKVRYYPYAHGIGPNDKTLDLDESLNPDFVQDAREPFPVVEGGWSAILMDPPYSQEDAKHYSPGPDKYPKPNLLLQNGLMAVRPGGRVGLLHYQLPSPPKAERIGFKARFVACIGVVVGFNNRIRAFTVFEKSY